MSADAQSAADAARSTDTADALFEDAQEAVASPRADAAPEAAEAAGGDAVAEAPNASSELEASSEQAMSGDVEPSDDKPSEPPLEAAPAAPVTESAGEAMEQDAASAEAAGSAEDAAFAEAAAAELAADAGIRTDAAAEEDADEASVSDAVEHAAAAIVETAAAEPGPVNGVLELDICGQVAAMACGEDDAPRLRRLAAVINRAGAGLAEAGIACARPLDDPRFMFMNAMTIADEMLRVEDLLAEAQAKLETQDRQLRALRQRARSAEAAQAEAEEKLLNTSEQHASAARQAFEASFAEVVTKAAKRLEAAAGRLEGR